MGKAKYAVIIATLTLVLYLVSVTIQMPYSLIYLLFLLTSVFTIWMAISILKNGKPSGKSFDDQWYDDIS